MEQRGRGRDSTVSHISTRPRSHLHGHHARTTDMHNSTVRTHTHTHTSRGAHPPHAHTACPHQPSTLIRRVIIQSARQRAATRIKQRAAAKRDIQALEDARAEDIRRGNMLKAKVVRCSVAQFVKAFSYCFLVIAFYSLPSAATTPPPPPSPPPLTNTPPLLPRPRPRPRPRPPPRLALRRAEAPRFRRLPLAHGRTSLSRCEPRPWGVCWCGGVV